MVHPAQGMSQPPRPRLILDSPSLVYRAFFALPASIRSPQGLSVNAVRGYLDMVSRGDLIAKSDHQPRVEQEMEVLLCWMDSKLLVPGNKYLLQIGSRTVRSVVKEIEYRLDVNTLEKNYSSQSAGLNDIVKATIRTASPLPFDSYADLRVNGGAILIDETSNVTVGACMIQ